MMTRWMLVLGALPAAAGLVGCAPCPGAPAEIGVVAGVSLAGIELGRPLQAAIDLYGEPAIQGLTFTFPFGVRGSVADANNNRIADPGDLVAELRALDPYDGRTAGGNGVGSAVSCVTAEFGKPDLTSRDVVYSAQGIGFVTTARITPQVPLGQIIASALSGADVSVYEVVVFFNSSTPFQPGTVPGEGG